MEISLLDYVVQQLQSRKRGWPTIARDTGIPYSTVGKIARGEIRDPGVRAIETLAKHLQLLERHDAERAGASPMVAAGR